MNKATLLQSQKLEFIDYLLKARLKRVSLEILENFVKSFKNIADIPKNKDSFVDEIVIHYKIMKNNPEFIKKFGGFIRDYVLCAGESEYLIEITDRNAFVKWINEWRENSFIGRRFDFYKHIHLDLGEKFISLTTSKNKIKKVETIDAINSKIESNQYLSFPSEAFLLVAYSKETKSVFSKDRLIDIRDTFEFEIILRKNSSLVSVRGNNKVVRDFFASVVEDIQNPLSMVKSIFIGDFDRKKSRPIVTPRKTIKIEKLREALNGQYLDMDAPISGDQATRVKFSFKGMRDVQEETHPIFAPAVQEAWKEQEKSRIGFRYNQINYSFSVTSNGGLYFRQFAPEEVITYVLLKISLL